MGKIITLDSAPFTTRIIEPKSNIFSDFIVKSVDFVRNKYIRVIIEKTFKSNDPEVEKFSSLSLYKHGFDVMKFNNDFLLSTNTIREGIINETIINTLDGVTRITITFISDTYQTVYEL